ncbi:MAG: PAS domain S-box protein [Longimicrobiales bacterium]|nr:PAS domain S-box protein [Longimicrobiales bacterium]
MPESQKAPGKSEEHYRRLIENVSDIIQVFDRDGLIRYTSPSVKRVLGYEPEEIAGQPAPHFVHPEDRPRVAQKLGEALGDPDYSGQLTFRLRHKNGTWRTCDVIAQAATDSEGRWILIVNSRDVTAQREAERALEEREARLRRLLSGVRAIVWECDARTWEFSYISPGVEEILGYPVELWYQDVDLWADTIHPEDRDWVVNACRRGVEETRDSTLEYRSIARDGTVVWLRDVIHVVTDETGEADRLQGVMIDITEERTLQERLRQAQKMEAVGRLAGGIAHDFNNVLTVIQGHADILLTEMDEDEPERRDVEQIRKSADHAASLTRQLLAFSRQQLIRPVALDLNALVEDLQGMLVRLIGETVTLETSFSDDLDRVEADPSQMEQVIVNLVVNAKDAMPDGGRIEIATRNVEMERGDVHVLPFPMDPGKYVLLTVTDTGTGIPPEVQERIFEPFFTTKEVGEGTGLGLSTVYGIVKQSGGYIHARSGMPDPSPGTTFQIYLPPVEGESSSS